MDVSRQVEFILDETIKIFNVNILDNLLQLNPGLEIKTEHFNYLIDSVKERMLLLLIKKEKIKKGQFVLHKLAKLGNINLIEEFLKMKNSFYFHIEVNE